MPCQQREAGVGLAAAEGHRVCRIRCRQPIRLKLASAPSKGEPLWFAEGDFHHAGRLVTQRSPVAGRSQASVLQRFFGGHQGKGSRARATGNTVMNDAGGIEVLASAIRVGR
jgi:hypothetical protein